MTNREKLGRMEIYDLLCMMNDKLLCESGPICVLDCAGADTEKRCRKHVSCRDCVVAWLSEEVTKHVD